MDYQSIMRFQEKDKRGQFDYLSTSNDNGNGINVRFQAQMAQNFLAQEKAKKETVKADTPAKKKVKKEKIPATLKNIVWHKYFETSLTGLCQCCKVENISKAIFDAGHIISEKNG